MTLQWSTPLISVAAVCEPPEPMISTERARLPRHTCGFGLGVQRHTTDQLWQVGPVSTGVTMEGLPEAPTLSTSSPATQLKTTSVEEVGPQACILFLL
ncbi:unnamed protein product [Arctogadus glacialis]